MYMYAEAYPYQFSHTIPNVKNYLTQNAFGSIRQFRQQFSCHALRHHSVYMYLAC